MVFYHRIKSTLNRCVSLVNFSLISSILHSLSCKNLKLCVSRSEAPRFSQSVCLEFLLQPTFDTEHNDNHLILSMILGPNSKFNAHLDMRSQPLYILLSFSHSQLTCSFLFLCTILGWNLEYNAYDTQTVSFPEMKSCLSDSINQSVLCEFGV